jgi:large subunit ribosomal protein L7/L12
MKVDELIKELNSLTVMEAVQLARALEKRWGVSSAIRINIFNPLADEPVEETKYEFDVIMNDCGSKKIEVIKVLRMLIPELGLKEAKDMAENHGGIILHEVGKEFAFQAKEQLEKAGAEVSVV